MYNYLLKLQFPENKYPYILINFLSLAICKKLVSNKKKSLLALFLVLNINTKAFLKNLSSNSSLLWC